MSESPNENTNTNSDFIDPLGVNEYAQPADTNASDGVDNLEQEVSLNECKMKILIAVIYIEILLFRIKYF